MDRYYDSIKRDSTIGAIVHAYIGANRFYLGKDTVEAGENTVSINSPDYKELSFTFTYNK